MIARRVAALAVFRTPVLIRVCCRPNETRASCAVCAGVARVGGGLGVPQSDDGIFCVVTKITAEYYSSVSCFACAESQSKFSAAPVLRKLLLL